MKCKSTVLFLIATALLVSTASAQTSALRAAGPEAETNEPSSTVRDVPISPGSTAKPTGRQQEFIIGANDVLSVNVWKEPELSSPQVPVRSDGKISLSLIGDVQAGGLTVQELQTELSKRLRDYVASPVVTVAVREMHSRTFNILGEVSRPGAYPLDKATTVVDAIALAGGFREWAKVKSIYILRRPVGGATQRVSFNYKSAIRGSNGDFELQPRDTIVVP